MTASIVLRAPWTDLDNFWFSVKFMIRSCFKKKKFSKKKFLDEIFGHLNIFSSLYKKHRKKWKKIRKKSIFREFFFDFFFEKSIFFSKKKSLFPMFFIKGWKNLQVKKNMVEKKVQKKKILLASTSNHLLFNAPGHIKNGSRSPEESSVERSRSQEGIPLILSTL